MRVLTALLTAFVLAFPVLVVASSVTTNLYYANSVSADIADSCKDLSVASATGVVSATCNHYRSSTSDEVDQSDSTLDVDTVVYCKCDNEGQTAASLAWGTGAGACTISTFNAGSWTLGTSSDGKNYILGGNCTLQGNSAFTSSSSLDLGDTSNGLENSSGSLAGR